MLAWDLHGTADGYVVKFGLIGAQMPVAEFQTFDAACAGYHLARRALLLLDATLATKPHTKEV